MVLVLATTRSARLYLIVVFYGVVLAFLLLFLYLGYLFIVVILAIVSRLIK